ncbi:MAG: hypothetical protein AB2L24_17725 [Mangrovibacterium sp.]
MFIFLFIKQETSFDDFHSNSNRIYRVTGAYHSKDGISTTGFGYKIEGQQERTIETSMLLSQIFKVVTQKEIK